MGNSFWDFEKRALARGFQAISGVDEAGRGPLAGPVVSAAVILPSSFHAPGLTDSKKLAPKKRTQFYEQIYQQAVSVGIGIIDAIEIDRINILQASLLSMVMAVKNLKPQPDYLLIDGKFAIAADIAQEAIIGGDRQSISVAAASIVAKVSRDCLMQRYHNDFPQFGFSQHKGYPTVAHKAAIRVDGHCFIHRKTFKGVREFV